MCTVFRSVPYPIRYVRCKYYPIAKEFSADPDKLYANSTLLAKCLSKNKLYLAAPSGMYKRDPEYEPEVDHREFFTYYGTKHYIQKPPKQIKISSTVPPEPTFSYLANKFSY